MAAAEATRILLVDDEPNVIEALSLHLRRRYHVQTATSGAVGLTILQRDPAIAVVLSDMRMPAMDGAAFLARARASGHDAVRMLLTGNADIAGAAAAVNDGQVFRFLRKPCPMPDLLAALAAAEEQHRLITSERVLLEQTLHGTIKLLTDMLALTNPAAFGRAVRIKQHACDLTAKLQLTQRWQVEVAAMLSQLGAITLPPETVDNLFHGRALSEAEKKMVARLPDVVEQLLANIPRLEVVRGILAAHARPTRGASSADDPVQQLIERSAHILTVAVDYDLLETQGSSPAAALNTLRGRPGRYDPEVLAAFATLREVTAARDELREVHLAGLRVGMVLADDMKMASGALLVAHGFEVTRGFLERIENFRPGMVKEPIRVLVRVKEVREPSPTPTAEAPRR